MSEHVGGELVDFLNGRLTPSRRRQVDDHLANCPGCAGEYRWIASLRDEALRSGMAHLTAARIVELASAPGRIDDDARRHLDDCESCRQELEWARALPDAEIVPDAVPARKRRVVWWALGGVTAAAATAAVWLFVVTPGTTVVDPADFARIAPLPMSVTRAPGEPGGFADFRLEGLERYAAGDWNAARESLGRAAQLRPHDAEVAIYLGSAQLLQGHPGEAATVLRRVVDTAEPGPLHDEASWQLANAELAAGRLAPARALLERLAAADTARTADAAELLAALPVR